MKHWGKAVAVLLSGLVVGSTVRAPRGSSKAILGEFVPVRPELTRVLMKSTLPLVVDIYWLRAINAIGTARTESEVRNLAEYGRVLTALDPDFVHVYWTLGLTIPFNRGREEWVNGALAIDLLEKGTARFPNHLQIKLLLGYSLMTFTDRDTDAARTFEEAAQLPGAPSFAGPLAARLYLRGGKFDTALAVATSMRDAAKTEAERVSFQERVSELLDEKVLRVLDAAGAAYKQKHGRYPSGLGELIAEGLTKPEDPRFEALRFDANGRALLPESHGRMKVFHDSFGGRDDDAPETWR